MENPQQFQAAEALGGRVDSKAIVGLIQRRGLLAVIVFAAVVGATVAFTWTQTPTYVAAVQLLVNTAKPQRAAASGAVPPIEDMMGIEPRDVDTQRRMLESPSLVTRAADKLGLGDRLQTLPIAVRVGTAKDSDVITLEVSDVDPQRAADLANGIAEAHIADLQSGSQNTARRAGEFIRKQLDQRARQLADAKEKVRAFKAEHGIADLKAELASRTASLADLSEQAAQAAAEVAGARNSAADYRRKLQEQKAIITSSTTTSRNPIVDQLTEKLAGLEAQRANVAATRGLDHTDVVKLDEEIRACREELRNAEATVKSAEVETPNPLYQDYTKAITTAEASAAAAAARSGALRSEAASHAKRLAQVPAIEAELGLLEQEAEVAQQMYTALLEQYQQVQVQEAMTPPIVEVISPAEKPESPATPRKMLNLAIGLVLGLIIAAMVVGAAESMDDRIRTSWQAQSVLGLPSLGVVPAVRPGRELLTEEGHSPAVANVFSAIRAGLRYTSPEGMPRTLLVTSPRAGDGKTTTAVNLAASAAESGLRTLLVGADLRHCDTHEYAGTAGEQGLTDILLGRADARSCLQASSVQNLWVLPAGAPVPNPVDLIDSEKMRATLQSLQGQFDAVILDSPACDQYSDAVLMAPMCDAVIPVVKVGATPLRVAEGAIDKLGRTGCRILGLLSTGVKVKCR